MISSINLTFSDFFKRRIVEVENNMTKNTTHYQEMITTIIQIQNNIIEQLPPDSKELLFKYEELESQIQAMIEESIYEQGFKDGVAFYKFIHSKT